MTGKCQPRCSFDGVRMLLTVHSVNMYASTWICTKEVGFEKEDIKTRLRQTSLAELRLEAPAMHVEE